MQDIADWLEKLGMSEYAQRFAENGIDRRRSPPSDRSRPQGHRRPARASAENAARPSGSLLAIRRLRTTAATAATRRLKTPPSAAKSR